MSYTLFLYIRLLVSSSKRSQGEGANRPRFGFYKSFVNSPKKYFSLHYLGLSNAYGTEQFSGL